MVDGEQLGKEVRALKSVKELFYGNTWPKSTPINRPNTGDLLAMTGKSTTSTNDGEISVAEAEIVARNQVDSFTKAGKVLALTDLCERI